MSIQNLIFDLDGTIIDSSDGVVAAVNYSLRQMGQPEQPPARIKKYIGYSLDTMYPDFTGVPVAELKRHFQIKAAETVVSTTTILGAADEVLHRLRQSGYRMAIATTKIRPHVDGIIKRFGWQDLFDAAVGGNEVARVKPDPEVMLLALERMQAEPEDTMVVGDTENDVLAARAVPMQVTAISSPYNGDEKLKASAPDYFIHSLEELEVLLTRLDANEAPDA